MHARPLGPPLPTGWRAQELRLLQIHRCGTACVAPLGQVKIENQSWWVKSPTRRKWGSGNHLSVERQLPAQCNFVPLHLNSMPPLARSSEHSTTKWIFVGGSRHWKLSCGLMTCTLRPVACQRLAERGPRAWTSTFLRKGGGGATTETVQRDNQQTSATENCAPISSRWRQEPLGNRRREGIIFALGPLGFWPLSSSPTHNCMRSASKCRR